MFSQQNSRPALSTAEMLLHEIELQKQNGLPESNLVSNMHLFLTNSFINFKEKTNYMTVRKFSAGF